MKRGRKKFLIMKNSFCYILPYKPWQRCSMSIKCEKENEMKKNSSRIIFYRKKEVGIEEGFNVIIPIDTISF